MNNAGEIKFVIAHRRFNSHRITLSFACEYFFHSLFDSSGLDIINLIFASSAGIKILYLHTSAN